MHMVKQWSAVPLNATFQSTSHSLQIKAAAYQAQAQQKLIIRRNCCTDEQFEPKVRTSEP